jgi:hypothetical protein
MARVSSILLLAGFAVLLVASSTNAAESFEMTDAENPTDKQGTEPGSTSLYK